MKIMEVCGTHTAAIFKSGIRNLLPEDVRLVSGPGCPVCVTPPSYISDCIELSRTPGNSLLCFGDMMKVPSTEGTTLSDAKASGAAVQMIYSPFDAIALAEKNTNTIYTIAAVGFETTAPAYALLIEEAEIRGLKNINLLTSLKSAIRAIEWICETGEDVDAFICPGHVSVITGSEAYDSLAAKYNKPLVIAGFEDSQLKEAVRSCLEDGPGVWNVYTEAVSQNGNPKAKALLEKYFDKNDALWRGLGVITGSGYTLKNAYMHRNAYKKSAEKPGAEESCEVLPAGCRCGEVILGRVDPPDCPLFGQACTPIRATGPCMVSSEGACGIWYRNRI